MSEKRETQPATQTPPGQEQSGQPQSPKKSWIELATVTQPYCAIPVLPRFQAEVPNWTGNRKDPDSERWLGWQIWPLQESEETSNRSKQDNNQDVIGRGRPETCSCQSPGSVECVDLHVTEARNRLKTELGPAFEGWGFNNMGKKVSKTWFSREEKKFEAMVKKTCHGKTPSEEKIEKP